MRRLSILATLAVAALYVGCTPGDDKDKEEEEEEYVDSGVFIEIPDDAFRARLFEHGIDLNNDGKISTSEAERCKSIILDDCEGIRSLEGIEYFTALEELTVQGTHAFPETPCGLLERLDLSRNTKLRYLNCSYNRLKFLDVTACTQLEQLDCTQNELTELDLQRQSALVSLICRDNAIADLRLDVHPALEVLQCSGNPIPELDVTRCRNLRQLYCGGPGCPIRELDLSGNPRLENLILHDTEVGELDLSELHELHKFVCQNNPRLERIAGLEQRTKLSYLMIEDCEHYTGSLRIADFDRLEKLTVQWTGLEALEIRECADMIAVGCGFNRLESLRISACPSLTDLLCPDNLLPGIDLNGTPALQNVYLPGNRFTRINLPLSLIHI